MKVLVIQNLIPPYNLPIYNVLGRFYNIELTVSHSGKSVISKSICFEETILPVFSFLGFTIHKNNLNNFCSRFDVVIAMGDIRWLSLMSLGFRFRRKFKLIYWGIGVTASYKKKFDEKSIWQSVRYFLMRRADALIFYSDYPVNKYIRKGFKSNKLFVAHNTVEVINTINTESIAKDRILFVGTLYKEKLVYELLEAFLLAKKKFENRLKLSVIGNGDEYENIMKWIIRNGLENDITMHGEIYDEQELEKYFKKSFACISPGQAGLSVLKSMGYGVPFITKIDAFTGGEIFNIKNGVNGILYCQTDELENILIDIYKNSKKYIEMGNNALTHYNEKRTPEIMAKGILNAIEFVCSKKINGVIVKNNLN